MIITDVSSAFLINAEVLEFYYFLSFLFIYLFVCLFIYLFIYLFIFTIVWVCQRFCLFSVYLDYFCNI